ncbi:MAG: hypothetical protein ABSA15_01445 [Thermoplasmata archaeon]|jgi:hypothetical protein
MTARRLHQGGRFRTWLGAHLGGDPELGDRAWRRILHCLGAGILIYYLFPPNVLIIVPNYVILLLALVAVILIETLRLGGVLELPTMRPYEQHRIASYAYFALALVLAVLLFPPPIAAAVVLGTAFIDPLIGELRRASQYPHAYPWIPLALYTTFATVAFIGVGNWAPLPALSLAVLAAVLALLVERPQWVLVDDDLAMTLVPAVVLYGIVLVAPGFVH